MTTAQKLYHHLLDSLNESDESEKKAIAKFLLAEKYGIQSIDLILNQAIPKVDLTYDIERLNQGEPVQYVTGKTPFANHTFLCGPGALIPRPETEELVFALIKKGPFTSILDIGTGTGCIAHSLALAFPNAYVEAWDVSSEALEWAEKNKQSLNTQVQLKPMDVLALPADHTTQWELIVSNPPYVLPSEKHNMLARVYDFEPTQALFVPEQDPLLFYRAITQMASQSLLPGGLLAFEINQAYGLEVVSLMKAYQFYDIELHQDIPGKDRMVLGRR